MKYLKYLEKIRRYFVIFHEIIRNYSYRVKEKVNQKIWTQFFLTFSCVILGNHFTSLRLSFHSCKMNVRFSSRILWASGKITYVKVPGFGFALGSISRGKYEKNAESMFTPSTSHPFFFLWTELRLLSFDSLTSYVIWVEKNRFIWLKSGYKSATVTRQTTCYPVSPASVSCLLSAPGPELPTVMVQAMGSRTRCSEAWLLLLTLQEFH